MGSIADHLAEPAVYVFKDVEHRVSPFTMAVQGAFERYIEAYAVQSYQRNSHLLSADDAGAIGASGTGWSDLFGASGFTLNFAAGDWVGTHSAGVFTVSTGDL